MFCRSFAALAVVASFSLAGCAMEEDGPAGQECEQSPEAPIGGKAITSNAGYLNAGYLNAGYLNAGYMNAGYMNAGYMNAGYVNAGFLNGVNMQGMQMQGMQLQGTSLQGIQANGIQVNGAHTEIVGVTKDGVAMRGADFVGATIPAILSNGTTINLRIASYEPTADADIVNYRLEYNGQNICGDGNTGMFVTGVWDETGARHDALTVGAQTIRTTYACSVGVIAKCVTWGYKPWSQGVDAHQTCTRMARADYCGNGVSFTKNGTAIDVFDSLGVQAPTGDASFLFEAGWGPNGAVCVSRTRFDGKTTNGDSVVPSCWHSLPRCDGWSSARELGARLANASRAQSRVFCGQ